VIDRLGHHAQRLLAVERDQRDRRVLDQLRREAHAQRQLLRRQRDLATADLAVGDGVGTAQRQVVLVLRFGHIIDRRVGAGDRQLERVRRHLDRPEQRQDHVLAPHLAPQLAGPDIGHPLRAVRDIFGVHQLVGLDRQRRQRPGIQIALLDRAKCLVSQLAHERARRLPLPRPAEPGVHERHVDRVEVRVFAAHLDGRSARARRDLGRRQPFDPVVMPVIVPHRCSLRVHHPSTHLAVVDTIGRQPQRLEGRFHRHRVGQARLGGRRRQAALHDRPAPDMPVGGHVHQMRQAAAAPAERVALHQGEHRPRPPVPQIELSFHPHAGAVRLHSLDLPDHHRAKLAIQPVMVEDRAAGIPVQAQVRIRREVFAVQVALGRMSPHDQVAAHAPALVERLDRACPPHEALKLCHGPSLSGLPHRCDPILALMF